MKYAQNWHAMSARVICCQNPTKDNVLSSSFMKTIMQLQWQITGEAIVISVFSVCNTLREESVLVFGLNGGAIRNTSLSKDKGYDG